MIDYEGYVFADRAEAGTRLGAVIGDRLGPEEDAVILGLPRGGVVVAREVARLTRRPLDFVVVRKIGAPENEEVAIGAVGEDGEPVLDKATIERYGISPMYVSMATARVRAEVQRRVEAYRQGPRPSLQGKTAVLVDDGIATGYTVEAAVETVRRWGAARVVVAVPVAPPEAVARLRPYADDVIALHMPRFFMAVGQFYADFQQVTDDEVKAILTRAATLAA
ncbi:MAG TPA: phosphoribosyltransferase family protein [bacterium]|nr:phosphoribosyltransferase family protein [bacterium]